MVEITKSWVMTYPPPHHIYDSQTLYSSSSSICYCYSHFFFFFFRLKCYSHMFRVSTYHTLATHLSHRTSKTHIKHTQAHTTITIIHDYHMHLNPSFRSKWSTSIYHESVRINSTHIFTNFMIRIQLTWFFNGAKQNFWWGC